MQKNELKEILEKHKKWLNDEEGGERANLRRADLGGADLSYADLRRANLSDADLSDADLRSANLSYANLSDANLRRADLSYANLSDANLSDADLSGAYLSGANIDFSSLPLWCGSLRAHFDDRQLAQIAYHLVKAGLNSQNASDKTKSELSKIIDFANKFHRVGECGKIEYRSDGNADVDSSERVDTVSGADSDTDSVDTDSD